MSSGIPPRVMGVLTDNLGLLERTNNLTFTIKAGTGFDCPWFTTDAVDLDTDRKNMLTFADLMEESELPDGRKVCQLSTLEVTVVVARLFQGAWAQRPSKYESNATTSPAKSSTAAAATVKNEAPAAEAGGAAEDAEEAAVKALVEVIDACTSKKELTELFKRRAAEMKPRPEVMAALQTKSSSF